MENFSIRVVLPNFNTATQISSTMKTVQDLKEKISLEFQIKERFSLVLNDCVLPANENIRVLMQANTVKVVTDTPDYYPFTGIRVKLDLSFYYRDLRKFGYVWIAPEIKNFENFKNHILEMCSISGPVKLRLNGSNFNSLGILNDEDVITVLPDDCSLSLS